MRAIQQQLWGTQGGPPPSWKQGFFFNTKPRLGFGLVQVQGGPCGVLAAVQAHILAALKLAVRRCYCVAAVGNFSLGSSQQGAAAPALQSSRIP